MLFKKTQLQEETAGQCEVTGIQSRHIRNLFGMKAFNTPAERFVYPKVFLVA